MNPEPIATYRVQLRPKFGFVDAEKVVPYLAELGISHFYSSPYLQAAAGSAHGYDVVDPTQINRELGGEPAHARLCEALRDAGLEHMLDVVPNHMAIAGKQNPWWWDVLENGPSSRYATFFDVDWDASEDRWPNKVLLPVLGDHYGRILEDGQLELVHEQGVFTLHYHDQVFPVDPSSLAELLARAAEACGSELVGFLAESHARLPRPTVTARHAVEWRHRDKAVLLELLSRLCREDPRIEAAIEDEVARLNRNPDALDALLELQNYRLAFWRTASRDVGYRRFFDIKDLAGLRVEDLEVFQASHGLPISLVRRGWVQGLRIDHPDGLRDPADYFYRLREACPDTWLVAEKILEPGETLPSDWPIEGTTGYDFLNLVTGLFIDRKNENKLTKIYEEFIEDELVFPELVRTCKRQVLTELLGSELNRLTSLFVDVCERHRRHRDYTRYELREALCETAVCFPVYRSYVSASRGAVSREDENMVAQAVNAAKTERPDLDPELLRFLGNLLLLRVLGTLEGELAMRFQQLTSPAMAKGLEDTAFYRYHRLTALNEVGGDPNRFGITVEQFHEACIERQARYPHTMLASTTHDTKRSEDVRARLALLSEIPARWHDTVRAWAVHNERHRKNDVPDRNTEYLLYQTLVGAWPITLERMTGYMEKAVREAKVHTRWTQPDEAYENALHEFVQAVMTDEAFRAKLVDFVNDLVYPGRLNSLAQTLLKLTAPGIPDIYQGTELWDLSLVDPDNRRPVDFTLRRQLLKELEALTSEAILARMDEGVPKLWVIRQALQLRRRRSALFGADGSYRPLTAKGTKAEHVVAYLRGDAVAAVTPRLIMGLQGDWEDTVLGLPEGRWVNVLTGDDVKGGEVEVETLLARFPVGLLERKE